MMTIAPPETVKVLHVHRGASQQQSPFRCCKQAEAGTSSDSSSSRFTTGVDNAASSTKTFDNLNQAAVSPSDSTIRFNIGVTCAQPAPTDCKSMTKQRGLPSDDAACNAISLICRDMSHGRPFSTAGLEDLRLLAPSGNWFQHESSST
eukprot:1340289-Amphidinium_carterae.1